MKYLIFAVVSILFDTVESQEMIPPPLPPRPTWPYDPFGAEIMIPIGSNLKIKCHTTKTESPLSWSVESKGESSANRKIEKGPGWASYSIEKTQREDYGRYTCEDKTRSSLKQSIVVFSPDIIFNTIISGETITDKSTVDFRVLSEYDHIAYYSYRKVDLPENNLPYDVQVSGSYMRISGLGSEYEGRYACTVQANSTAVGVIRVVYTTQLIRPSQSCLKFGIIARGFRPHQYKLNEFMEGSPLLLRCDITSTTPPKWKKFNKDIKTTNTSKQPYVYGRCLVFPRLTQADKQIYKCFPAGLQGNQQCREKDEIFVDVINNLESSWGDMNWEITWTAGEFTSPYTYDIKEYCKLSNMRNYSTRVAKNSADPINKILKGSQLSTFMMFIASIGYFLT